jgi:hypothetical protein
MASEGPLSPGTLADDSAVGTVAWSNPTNAASSNDSDASAAYSGGNAQSHYLKATNFGFAIPAGATIDGVVVEIERAKSGIAHAIRDAVVSLVKGGSVSGNNKADLVTAWTNTDTYITYGSSGDLWGLALAPADVNASNFGVVLSTSATLVDEEGTTTAFVDHIRITVYYTEAAGNRRRRVICGAAA